MISQLEGAVLRSGPDFMIVRVEGTGLGLHVTVPARAVRQPGSAVTLHTHVHMANDELLLAGFETLNELEIFRHLLGVSGVGPRMAVRVLSTHPPARIVAALDSEDPSPFEAVSGIGRKLASRIILELRGRLVPEEGAALAAGAGDGAAEALEALLTLGYTRAEATLALNQTAGDELSVEARIAAALRELGGRIPA